MEKIRITSRATHWQNVGSMNSTQPARRLNDMDKGSMLRGKIRMLEALRVSEAVGGYFHG